MKVYAAISYNDEYKEWINLVITETGAPVSCNAFNNEKDCRFDMVEGSKLKLNQRYSEMKEKYGVPIPAYEIIVLEKNDPLFLRVRELNDIHQARATSFWFKIQHKLSIRWSLFKIALVKKLPDL